MLGRWAMPSFLKEFFSQLDQRFTLATPAVIAAWVQKLRQSVSQLKKLIVEYEKGALLDSDDVGFQLAEIADTYQIVNKTVHDNCERISEEVADYRVTTDAAISKQKMRRLIFLHDQYLEPILQLLTIDGEFRNVSDDVASCCTRLRNASLRIDGSDAIADKAAHIRQDIVWLRRVMVRRAEESRRELGPLCEVARRESQIAKGVNRCLDAIAKDDWSVLNLDDNFGIVDFKNSLLFSDFGVEKYLAAFLDFCEESEPTISSAKQTATEFPLNTEDVLEQLDLADDLDDLLQWMTDRFDGLTADHTMSLFNSVLLRRPWRVANSFERTDYQIDKLVIDAMKWKWGDFDNDQPSFDGGDDPAANENDFQTTENRSSRLPR
jgi:predicted DNA-binding protein YlxM (UPF0122 family)